MKPSEKILACAVLALALPLAGCDDDSSPTAPGRGNPAVVFGSGDVTAQVNEFRTLLGNPLNGVTVGQQAAGRREINWDGVPAAFSNVSTFPGDFFNTRSPRGAVFTGSSFRVSDTNFLDLLPGMAGQFRPFSPSRIFAPVGSRTMDVAFQVAGGTEAARVRGFGVVFLDVDQPGSALLEFFGTGGSLGVFDAPASASGGASFLGVMFDDAVVTRVRITSGSAPLTAGATESGGTDLVAMDDFLYDEPRR